MPDNNSNEVQTAWLSYAVGSAVVLVVLILCIAAFTLRAPIGDFFGRFMPALQKGDVGPDQSIENAKQAAAQGAFFESIQLSEPLVLAETPAMRSAARSTLALSSFASGDEESRINAVRIVKQDFLIVRSDLDRALAINKLLAYIMTGEDQYIYDEVFTGEPFASYRVEGDWSGSLRKLAEFSLSFYETPQALQRVAFWYAARLTNYDKKYSLSKGQKEEYIDQILALIARIDGVYPGYERTLANRSYEYLLPTQHAFWKTYLYAVVAQSGRPEYLVQSKQALDELVRISEAAVDAEGNVIPLASISVPEAEFIYAKAVFLIKKEDGYEEVRYHLGRAVSVTEANPGLQEGTFIAIMRNAALTPERHKIIPKLAALDPNFKVFLQKYGWKFDTATSTKTQ